MARTSLSLTVGTRMLANAEIVAGKRGTSRMEILRLACALGLRAERAVEGAAKTQRDLPCWAKPSELPQARVYVTLLLDYGQYWDCEKRAIEIGWPARTVVRNAIEIGVCAMVGQIMIFAPGEALPLRTEWEDSGLELPTAVASRDSAAERRIIKARRALEDATAQAERRAQDYGQGRVWTEADRIRVERAREDLDRVAGGSDRLGAGG